MKYAAAATILLASTAAAFAGGISVSVPGGGGISIGWESDGSNAVVCVMNEVHMLAESDGDCTKAGGTVVNT